MVKVCEKCYWMQVDKTGVHYGCFVGKKWKMWIPKRRLCIPNECPDFKMEENK